MVSYKEEIITDRCVFGLRCKDTQAKILALGKGLPTLDAVITKAEAEEADQGNEGGRGRSVGRGD